MGIVTSCHGGPIGGCPETTGRPNLGPIGAMTAFYGHPNRPVASGCYRAGGRAVNECDLMQDGGNF